MKHQSTTNNKIKFVDGICKPEKTSGVPVSLHRRNLKNIVFYSALKVGGVGVLVCVLFLGVTFSGSTVAYFNDTETSVGNRMQAGTISFNLSSLDDRGGALRVARFASDEIVDETTEEYEEEVVGTESFSVDVAPATHSLPLLYSVKGELNPDNSPGCDLMTVKVFFGDYHYNGLVKDFVSPKVSEIGEWSFIIELPEFNDALEPNAECKGSMVFNAELSGVSDDLSKTYTDKKSYAFDLYNWDNIEPEIIPVSSAVEPIEEPAPKEEIKDAPEEVITPLVEEIPTKLVEPQTEQAEKPTEEPKEDVVEPLSEPVSETPVDIPTPEIQPELL
jgi:predicted ribosomally synthesized peptide with SipW-like signal peptide